MTPNECLDAGSLLKQLANDKKRIAELEAALEKLLQATSDSAVMYSSQKEVWVEAQAVLTKPKDK